MVSNEPNIAQNDHALKDARPDRSIEIESMRILIADDQPKVRFALRVALERQPGSKTVGEVTDAADLIAQAHSFAPNLLLLDWDLPGMPAPDLIRQLRQICPQLLVIVLSEKSELAPLAITVGANAFVSKADPPEHLLAAISKCWRKP